MGFLRVACLLLLGSSCVHSVRAANQSSFTEVNIYGAINDGNLVVPTLVLQLATEPVTIHIDSPGGEVYAGLAFIDEVHSAQRRGIPVVCVVDGMAASMAAVILESCSMRLMHRQSSILFHTASMSGEFGGNQWSFERLAKELAEVNKRLAIFISGRLNMSLAQYEERVHDTDWWLGYEEALQVGAIDGVL